MTGDKIFSIIKGRVTDLEFSYLYAKWCCVVRGICPRSSEVIKYTQNIIDYSENIGNGTVIESGAFAVIKTKSLSTRPENNILLPFVSFTGSMFIKPYNMYYDYEDGQYCFEVLNISGVQKTISPEYGMVVHIIIIPKSLNIL